MISDNTAFNYNERYGTVEYNVKQLNVGVIKVLIKRYFSIENVRTDIVYHLGFIIKAKYSKYEYPFGSSMILEIKEVA